MKTTSTLTSCLAKRFAACTKNLFLITLSILAFNSCKKELFTGEKESLTIAQTGTVKVSNINYSSFLERVNLNSLGTLKTTFQSQPANGKLMSLDGTASPGGLGFLTDSIREVTTTKGKSYVFRLPQTSTDSRIFQNLTISVLKDTTIVFVTTYTPSNEWIINRKSNIHKGYKGEVSYTSISLSAALSQQLPLSHSSGISTSNGKLMSAVPNRVMESVTICNTFVIYSEVIYGCSQGNHMQNDPECPWNFGPAPPGEHAGGTMYIAIPLTFCSSIAVDIGNSGGGSGGGPNGSGGETSPYPPEGYNPCEPGLPCTEIFGESAAQTFANQIGLTDFNSIALLGDPANVQVLGYMKNYYTAYGNSSENKEFLKWIAMCLTTDESYNANFADWAIKSAERGIPYMVLELIQKQQDFGNYLPRDQAPSSMPMRQAFTNSDGSANFSSLNRITPQYFNVNGQIVANPDAYNCHTYAFGLNDPDGIYDSDNPKWMSKMIIQTKRWNFVTANAKVGDIIMYFKNINGQLDWTHSAVVTEVDPQGYAVKAKSKMGEYEVVEHHPADVTDAFGVAGNSFDLGGKSHPSRVYIRKK